MLTVGLRKENRKNEMTDLWVAKPIQLKYLLGEITLFVVKFPALVFNGHFTDLTTDLDEMRPSPGGFSREVEAFLIRSHPVDRELPRLDFLPQAIRYVPARYNRYYIDLQSTFQEYLNKFSPKSRSTLQRKVRKFSDFCGGEICWREYRYDDEIDEFYRLAREVSRKTYQDRLLNAGLPDSVEFARELQELARRDQLRGYLLFHEGNPIAYLYCPIQSNILFYRYLGYDPEFKQWSPGTILQYLALEKLFTEGKFRMFDFTEGQGPHKEFFSTGSTQCADIYYIRPTSRNFLLLRLHSGLKTLSSKIVEVLNRLGLKSRIKKLIRSKA